MVAAPSAGVIVRWRIRDSVGSFALRMARQPSPGAFVGVGTSAPVTIASPVPATFDVRLPVQAGDLIGVDIGANSSLGSREFSGAQEAVFVPTLADGAPPRSPEVVSNNFENLVNADLEPDADGDGFGDETQDLCAKDATTQGLCGGPCANDRTGGSGDDNLQGTVAGDRMIGAEGNDILNALAGDDCLDGGVGNDRMTAGEGTDRLDGRDGDDIGDGGPGTDRLTGELGNDRLNGSDGDDGIDGGPGNDTLLGGRGRDELLGGNANDTLLGEAGDDRLFGGAGRDALSGGGGRDNLNGVSGDDRLNGGAGNDALSGGSLADVLRGGLGNDSLNGGPGNDRLEGGPGRDRITDASGTSRISGGSGNDDIRVANRRRDRVTCGPGRDRVLADVSDRVAGDCERVTRAGRRRS